MARFPPSFCPISLVVYNIERLDYEFEFSGVSSHFAATRFVDCLTPRKRTSNVIVFVNTSMLPSILPSLDEICKTGLCLHSLNSRKSSFDCHD